MKELSKDPRLCEAGSFLGAAGQIAAGFDVRDLDRQEVVATLIDEAADEEMIRGLEVLAECFEQKRSLQGLARTRVGVAAYERSDRRGLGRGFTLG